MTPDELDEMLAALKERGQPWRVAKPYNEVGPMQFTEPNLADPTVFQGQMLQAVGQAQTQGAGEMEALANRRQGAILRAQQKQVRKLRNQVRKQPATFNPTPPPRAASLGAKYGVKQ